MCISCGNCISVCPTASLCIRNGSVVWNSVTCTQCDACIAACSHRSNPKVRYMTASEVMDELSDAMPYITGITASGGECTLYDAFLCDLFTMAGATGKNTMADTNGERSFDEMPELLRIMDSASLDVKTTDNREHLELTGKPVETVLKNLEILAEAGKLYEVRTVIVPNRLDSHRTVADVAKRMARYPEVVCKLIRFRPYGVCDDWKKSVVPSEELMQSLVSLAKAGGIKKVEVI